MGKGEITIDMNQEVMKTVEKDQEKLLKIFISFSIENPQGGLHFNVGSADEPSDFDHVYTLSHENSSRLWFPCLDTYTQPCTWDMEFTVCNGMTAVSCGELMESVFTPDGKKTVFYYRYNNMNR